MVNFVCPRVVDFADKQISNFVNKYLRKNKTVRETV